MPVRKLRAAGSRAKAVLKGNKQAAAEVIHSNHTTPTLFCPHAEPVLTDVPALHGDSIRLLNWNIQKGLGSGWQADLGQLAMHSDLVLIQEAAMQAELLAAPNRAQYWSFAPGYKHTGVLTFSAVPPASHRSLQMYEPWLGTPKATNITEFRLAGREESLLVVNIHAVNFTVGLAAFRRQLQQAEQLIARHHGPVIFSGDFNTWRAERHALLDQLLAALQLQALRFEDDQRTRVLGRHLDHIYVRGLQAKATQSFKVASSDHNPMQVVLGLY